MSANKDKLTIKSMVMSVNNEYKIKNVVVSTNGHNEVYFDVEWEGDKSLDSLELRVWEDGKDYCLECYACPSHNEKVVVSDHAFLKMWESRKVNNHTIYVELGIAKYSEDGKVVRWQVLADYKPIALNLYYEHHIFRKNVLELR
jgi:hypothetical protein